MERYAEALADASEEVTIMEMTWAEQMMARGRVEGLRTALRRFLEQRFGHLPEASERRLAAIDEADALERLSDRAFRGASLDELGLA